MRPLALELEGFSAYRETAEVDFGEVDFFSLTGPTGSGKSSLIDAMIFALFGRVPRLGGNAVAPAIAAGADRARVRFDFAVGGEAYTVARMAVRTSSGGASVKEARLAHGGEVIASGADDVTTAVEELLRLRFEDFTRTVVLPQGDFARFLTATKAERQGLLRNLLGLDVYTVVRELARARQAIATERAESARRSLDSLEVPDADEALAARKHLDALEKLGATIVEREKRLSGLEMAVAAARAEDERLAGSIERLEGLAAPDRLGSLGSLITAADDDLTSAESAVEELEARAQATGQKRNDLPSMDRLSDWARAREKMAALESRLAESDLESQRQTLAEVEAVATSAATEHERARSELASARLTHAAHGLAGRLVMGEPCPVCAQVVTEVPETEEIAELEKLEHAESRAGASAGAAREALDAARTELTKSEAGREELATRREELGEELADVPAPDEIAGLVAEVEQLIDAERRLAGELQTAAKVATAARSRLEDLAEESRRVGRKLTEAQLSVADLTPDLSESDDPIVQWKELLAWSERLVSRLRPELEVARESVVAAEASAKDERRSLLEVLEQSGIPGVEPYAVQVATALQTARTVVESHIKTAVDAESLTAQEDEATKSAAVAGALVNHLRANGFEQWLMAGALTELVDGANDLLGQLSAGGYSLHSDQSGSFSIVDHRNADEIRSVATLSGGETFLVSLALALSLAETLAAKGGSGLDAIILDEGFGTLDDESLDTVATVLEELTGRGLMVGVITHVKELAARAPVRYEVTRLPSGATVRQAS